MSEVREEHRLHVDSQASAAYASGSTLLVTCLGLSRITPILNSSRLRISVAFDADGELAYLAYPGPVVILLGAGDTLEAGCAYEYEFDITKSCTYDFAFSANANNLKCVVKEV